MSDSNQKPEPIQEPNRDTGGAEHPQARGRLATALRGPVVPTEIRLQHLLNWWQSPAGERLRLAQQSTIAEEVRRFHGDTLVWIGCHRATAEYVRRCMVRNRFYVALPGSITEPQDASSLHTFSSQAQELPMANGSVDAISLHHVLEIVDDPRQVLREACRVLAPGGRLILCGFNPLSPWGLANFGRMLAHRLDQLPLLGQGQEWLWGKSLAPLRFVSRRRLIDWLELLGFEPVQPVTHLDYSISGASNQLRVRNWLHRRQPPIANAYMMCMTKVTTARTPTPLTPELNNARLASVSYPKLAAWESIDSRS